MVENRVRVSIRRKREHLSDAQGRSFTWDFENRLTQAIVSGTNGGTTTFKYDPFGRRIQKSGPLGTTNYLYDGNNSVEEVDSAGNVLARYTQGSHIDEPFAELRSGTISYYEDDGGDSVTSLTSSAGAVANSYAYDSFGKLTASTGMLVNPFSYTTREFDQETSIYYYRARYYDPSVGRFISEDPIGFGGGTHFYRYASNNPVLFDDPLGLWINTGKPASPEDNTIICNGLGGIAIQIPKDQDLSCGIGNCIWRHENQHRREALARYTELALDEPFAELRSGTTSYYQQDGLDSVTSLTTSTGVLANSYAFDSFGNLTASTGSITNPFRFTGRDFDSETGLYFYRARYLDSGTGRFLNEDPLQFAGDGPDFYVYTLNNPIIYVDPMGTSSQDPPSPPTPGLPGTWGGPEPGGFVYNSPPPKTKPVHGPALNLADCMAHALARYFVVTGGSECTPDGRHKVGGVKGSKHCTNEAIDIRPAGQDQHSLFCAALNCGAQNIINEGDHYHVQTVRGPGGAQGLLPKPCSCPVP